MRIRACGKKRREIQMCAWLQARRQGHRMSSEPEPHCLDPEAASGLRVV